MLPRQNKNAIKIDISKDDDAEDIDAMTKEAAATNDLQKTINAIVNNIVWYQ